MIRFGDVGRYRMPQWTPYIPGMGFRGSVLRAWLRTKTATITGAGISSEPDLIAGGSAALQATDAQRPPRNISANGLFIETFTDDCLLLTPHAGNNQLTKWGFATHIAIDDLSVNGTILRMGVGTANEGAATDSLFIQYLSAGQVRAFVQTDATGVNRRSAVTGGGKLSSNYVFFLTWFDGTQATEDLRWNFYFNGVKETLSFGAVGSSASMPTTLRGAPAGAGNIMIGNARSNADTTHTVGRFGPNKYFFGGAMAGATIGPLTATMHSLLMKYEYPKP